jgi:endonuclease III
MKGAVLNNQDSAKKLTGLLRKLKKPSLPEQDEFGDPVEVLIKSFLIWDSTTGKASAAYKRIMERVVDYNDLRVSMPHELVEWIGPRYPMAVERCQRMRAALQHTYKREHAVSLERLNGLGRREVKTYLRSLDGISTYVADRVTLLCFEAHCIPVDDRLRRAMVKAGVCDDTVTINDLSGWLARKVKAADGTATHFALQSWSDRPGSGGASPKRRTVSKKVRSRA